MYIDWRVKNIVSGCKQYIKRMQNNMDPWQRGRYGHVLKKINNYVLTVHILRETLVSIVYKD
jgi:hypothetical protein